MTSTNVAYHVEDGVGRPAINVKVNAPGAAFWPWYPSVASWPHVMGGERAGDLVKAAYGRVQSDFWQNAEEIATQRGLGEITQEGRSGGWLVFTDTTTLAGLEIIDAEYDDADELENARKQRAEWLAGYRAMVEWAETWIADAPRKVAALAQGMAMDEAGEGAARRMFAFGKGVAA